MLLVEITFQFASMRREMISNPHCLTWSFSVSRYREERWKLYDESWGYEISRKKVALVHIFQPKCLVCMRQVIHMIIFHREVIYMFAQSLPEMKHTRKGEEKRIKSILNHNFFTLTSFLFSGISSLISYESPTQIRDVIIGSVIIVFFPSAT